MLLYYSSLEDKFRVYNQQVRMNQINQERQLRTIRQYRAMQIPAPRDATRPAVTESRPTVTQSRPTVTESRPTIAPESRPTITPSQNKSTSTLDLAELKRAVTKDSGIENELNDMIQLLQKQDPKINIPPRFKSLVGKNQPAQIKLLNQFKKKYKDQLDRAQIAGSGIKKNSRLSSLPKRRGPLA